MTKGLFSGKVTQDSLRRIDAVLAREPDRVARALKPLLQGWGQDWHRAMVDRFTNGNLRGPSDVLRNRRGILRGSLKAKLHGDSLSTFRLRMVSAGVEYARMQEDGGVITPKNAKFLTIPLEPDLTGAGRVRVTARTFIENHKGETFFLRKGGSLLLMWNKNPGLTKGGKQRKIKPVAVFALVKKVEIPGPKAPTKRSHSRLGFVDTWKKLEPKRKQSLFALANRLSKGGA